MGSACVHSLAGALYQRLRGLTGGSRSLATVTAAGSGVEQNRQPATAVITKRKNGDRNAMNRGVLENGSRLLQTGSYQPFGAMTSNADFITGRTMSRRRIGAG